jgi:hypothetical protein
MLTLSLLKQLIFSMGVDLNNPFELLAHLGWKLFMGYLLITII